MLEVRAGAVFHRECREPRGHPQCIEILAAYIRARPDVWNEDIGVSPGA